MLRPFCHSRRLWAGIHILIRAISRHSCSFVIQSPPLEKGDERGIWLHTLDFRFSILCAAISSAVIARNEMTRQSRLCLSSLSFSLRSPCSRCSLWLKSVFGCGYAALCSRCFGSATPLWLILFLIFVLCLCSLHIFALKKTSLYHTHKYAIICVCLERRAPSCTGQISRWMKNWSLRR